MEGKAAATDDTVFLLEENDGHIDVYLCHQGIGVECARWLDTNSATQLQRGLQAVLAGAGFVRATSLSNYLLDLQVAEARKTRFGSGVRASPSTSHPELDSL